jgi:polyisoprenoid-binding protein YceI
MLVAGLAATAPPPAKVAEPPVPEALADGVAYHAIAGRQAQVNFRSEAPLQNIIGKSNAVVGWVVPGLAPEPAAFRGGRWLLPVASLATGIPLRDEHLAGDHWLDAARHPVIDFRLKKVDDIVVVKEGEGFRTVACTLDGELEMHGVTRPLRVTDAKVSMLEASPRTGKIAPGDLLFIQCGYEVRLSDFGIENGDVPGKVSDTIRLEQTIRMTTAILSDPEPADRTSADGGEPRG